MRDPAPPLIGACSIPPILASLREHLGHTLRYSLMRAPERACRSSKRAGSDDSSSESDTDAKLPSAKRICSSSSCSSMSSAASISLGVACKVASLHPLEMGVEEALCEIFGAAPGTGPTTPKSIAGALHIPMFPEEIASHRAMGTQLADLEGETAYQATGGLWIADGASVSADESESDVGPSSADSTQLDMDSLETTMRGWTDSHDKAFNPAELVSLGDLIGSLERPAQTGQSASLAGLPGVAPVGRLLTEGSAPSPSGRGGGHKLAAATHTASIDGGAQAAAPNRKEWAVSEDEAIRAGVEQLGTRWRAIAAMLPGRSDDAVRNRWARLQNAGSSKPVSEISFSRSR